MDYSKPFKYISEIARCQSISLAAEKLNIQQPALSKYLKKIETELGVELFDRNINPLALTEAGKCYINTAQKIIDAENQLQKQISELKRGNTTIKVGISPSRAPYLLPNIIKLYQNKEQNGNIIIVEGTTEELTSGLTHGDLDLIISLSSEGTKEFRYIELFSETILLAVPESAKILSFEDAFNSFNIISSGKGQLMTDLLDMMPNHISLIECQNILTSLELVRSGIGAALVPSYINDYGNSKGISYFKLPQTLENYTKRTVCVFYRKQQFLSSSEKLFIESSIDATISISK